jgi:hypothetical protein
MKRLMSLCALCRVRSIGVPANLKVGQLVDAAEAGNAAGVVALLDGPQPPPINAKDAYGYTATVPRDTDSIDRSQVHRHQSHASCSGHRQPFLAM